MQKFPAQPTDEDGPVFNEPWEALAFSLVLALHEKGQFSRGEWAETLSEQIKTAQLNGDPDIGNTYYHHWLNALENITLEKNISSNREIHEKVKQWREAYLSTPHGQPVELK